ncbi:MAG TPA: LapA family protein [Acidimicrobiia bacterium]|nr:LapA family protein [Acidimicrobiia bacterium]
MSASIGEPTATAPIGDRPATVPADDDVLAAANARRALSPDMPRVAWLRTQLQQMEARQRERLVKTAQLTVIAIVFITFVIQNSRPVNVHFLLFSLDIRLIWVIFGCGVLGGVAGYLIGRPDKSLRALLPQREKKPRPAAARTRSAAAKR